MKNLFIFIYNENILTNSEYTNIIDYYKQHYVNFIVVLQNNNSNNSFINNIIRKEKLSNYFELEHNKNINLFILNNLNNVEDYDNYVFLYGNLLEYNNIIINDLEKNRVFKTKFDINKFDLISNNFSYNILDKNDIYEIKRKYMIL
jgi:hypothetical protein